MTISVIKTAINMGPVLLVMIRLHVRVLQNKGDSLNVSALQIPNFIPLGNFSFFVD